MLSKLDLSFVRLCSYQMNLMTWKWRTPSVAPWHRQVHLGQTRLQVNAPTLLLNSFPSVGYDKALTSPSFYFFCLHPSQLATLSSFPNPFPIPLPSPLYIFFYLLYTRPRADYIFAVSTCSGHASPALLPQGDIPGGPPVAPGRPSRPPGPPKPTSAAGTGSAWDVSRESTPQLRASPNPEVSSHLTFLTKSWRATITFKQRF